MPAHVSALSAYANAIEAPAVAAAWERSILPPTKKADERADARFVSISDDGATNDLNYSGKYALRSDLMALFKLQRFNGISDVVCQKIDSENFVDQEALDLLYMLGRSHRLEAETTNRLIRALMKVNVPPARLTEVRGLISLLAINSGFSAIAKRQLQHVHLVESKDYISGNIDLAEGYKERALEVALEHFDDHGRREGRAGFSVLERVSKSLSALLKRPIGPRDLVEKFDETFGDSLVTMSEDAV